MVPNGWEVKILEDLASVERGKFSARPRNDPKYYGGEIPFVQTGDIAGAKTYLKSYSQTLNEEGLKVSRLFPKNTILITIAANIGDVAITSFDVACPDSLVAIQPKENADVVWLYFYLETCQKELDGQATQNAQKNINLQVLRPLKILTPPLPEQQKIAKILSTWDKAISTTERLIDNSTQQKKALMQQLLTGKKRLLDESGKRFEGEWEEVKLGEISHITTGNSNREDSSLTGKYAFFDRSIDVRTSGIFLFDAEAVIVGGEGQDFVPKYFEGKFDLHQRTYAIMDFKNAYGKFLFYYIGYYRYYFLSQAVGSTVKSLRLPMFQKMPIKLPSVKEQQKIATVLTNADKEIELLEQQLADLQQEKKALMQVLLTGKKRVVD
ncbi:restriction endonuclease subunit S [Psychrobacter namhaensis]|uniref:restriction endonuclease subunit S n=1 Tax=Psychrobacter namhaensis TaxID=292734 RepID=UPI003CFFC78C